MRMTDLYDLRCRPNIRKSIADGLMHDIKALAEHQFGYDEFETFIIKVKLVPLGVKYK